jgi:putative flavoprotein involved in K+ transport
VGAGNSGLQIADELAAAGREVTVAIGSRPRTVRQRPLGKDLFWWLTRTGLLDKTADTRLAARFQARELVIGTSFRSLRRRGITLRPRLTATDGSLVHFADGAAQRTEAVVWATGFRSDYAGWTSLAPSSTAGPSTPAGSPPSPA